MKHYYPFADEADLDRVARYKERRMREIVNNALAILGLALAIALAIVAMHIS